MIERRASKRTVLKSSMIAKRLDNDEREEVDVEVMNVSKTGIGFKSERALELGAVYEAYLTIWTKEIIHAFIEVVRMVEKENDFEYGGLFIGMPEIDLQRIDVYNVVSDPESYINNEER